MINVSVEVELSIKNAIIGFMQKVNWQIYIKYIMSMIIFVLKKESVIIV